jgi:hypothetical protein
VLITLDLRALSVPEAIEWNIGIGEALVLEHQLGPASQIFGEIIPYARGHLTPAETEKLIEWWASAASGMAETLVGTARTDRYHDLLSMLKMMTDEALPSRAAIYWSVVAARGMGDFDPRGTPRLPCGFVPGRWMSEAINFGRIWTSS